MAATIQTILKPTKARALDTSGNNNHGQIYSGRALEFDGVGDYLNAGTGVDLGTDDFTISTWVYLNAIGADENLFYKKNDNNNRWYFIINSSGKLTFYSKHSASLRLSDSGDTALEANTWYRIAVSVDRDSFIKFYINGVLDGTGSGDTNTIDNTGDLAIGLNGTAGGTYVDGMMSDVQIWDAAFTADDALYDYLNPEQLVLNRGGTSLTNSNLKLWYPMNDGHRGQQSYILDASNTGVGDELIDSQTDRDFSGSNNWVLVNGSGSATMSTTGGQLVFSGSTTSDYPYLHRDYTTDFKAGDSIRYELVLSDVSGGTVKVQLDGGANIGTGLTSGTNVFYHNGTSGNALKGESRIIPESSSMSFKIDSLSLKPVNNKNHATTVFHGDEIVVNGAMAADSDWTKGTGWTIGSGTADCDGSQSGNTVLSQTYSGGFEAGRTYQVQFTISDYTAGEINPHITGISSGNVTGNGTKTSTIVASADNDDIVMYASAAFDAKIDDVSIKEVGTATGWTDADQQLDIPQTALQSYNQLAWFPGVDPGTDISAKISDHASIDDIWTNGGTCSAWVYIASDGAGTMGRIFDKAKWSLYAYSESGSTCKLAYAIEHATTNGTGQTTNRVLTYGNWYHILMTYNSNSGASAPLIYINGESIAVTEDTESAGSVTTDNGQHLYIGNRSNGERTFDGTITEVSLWDEILTQAEVNELYNDGKAFDAFTHSNRTALICYVRNNGLATWSDLSSNSNNAVPTNLTETMLITAGADATRDSQGFLMNRQRTTNSLNTNEEAYTTVEINHTFGTADFSYGFWFKLEDTENGYLVGVQSMGNSTGVGLTIDVGDGKIRSRPFGVTAVYTSAAYDDGEWHYAHHNIDRSANAILYIDGATAVLTQSISGVTGNVLSTNSWNIGAESGTGNFLAGEIDDLIVYTDILTTTEITRNYNAGKRSHR